MRLNDVRILLDEIATVQSDALDLPWDEMDILFVKTESHYVTETQRLNKGLTEAEEKRQEAREAAIVKILAKFGAQTVTFPGDIRGGYSVKVAFRSGREILFIHE